jgi:uncharacterized UBP type Zn finger protein
MKEDASGKVRLAAEIQRKIKRGSLDTQGCIHIGQIQDVVPLAAGCEDCLKLGDGWVNLRLCLTCGYVGCCDNSKNKHATHHHNETSHPMIVSYELEETWLWCYVDMVSINP